MSLQPVHGFGVEMVGRLVEQQKVRLFEQQLAERDAAALAAREFVDRQIVRRTAERIHRLIDLRIEIPKALGLDLVLQLRHFIGGLVGIIHGEFVVAIEDRLSSRRRPASHCRARRGRIELRLLRQIADAGAFGDETLAR